MGVKETDPDPLVTEMKVECTCGNKHPEMEITNIDSKKAVRFRCEICKSGYLRVINVAAEDDILKGPGYFGE